MELETERVYKELGSPEELLGLIDNPPSLQLQLDIPVSIFSASKKKHEARIYVFDRTLIVAVKGKRDEGAQRAWLAEAPVDSLVKEESVVGGAKVEGSGDDKDFEELHRLQQEQHKEAGEFSLCLYADLCQTFPALYHSKQLRKYALLLTHVSRHEGEEAVSVDQAELWLDEEQEEDVKALVGHLQENVQTLFRVRGSTPDRRQGSEAGYRRTLGKSLQGERMRKTRVSNTGPRKRRNTRSSAPGSKGRVASSPRSANAKLKAKIEQQARRKKEKDRSAQRKSGRESDSSEEREEEESGEFVVLFGARKMGFQVNDGRKQQFGIFVSGVESGSLADAAGVCVGDKLSSIDGKEINDTTDFEKIQEMIQPMKNRVDKMKIVFSRTKGDEMKLRQREKTFASDARSRRSTDVSEDNEFSKNKMGDLLSLADTSTSFENLPPTVSLQEMFVIKRKTGTKRSVLDDPETDTGSEGEEKNSDYVFARAQMKKKVANDKLKVWNRMRKGMVIINKMIERKKDEEEAEILADEKEQADNLFVAILRKLTQDKEKTCVYALKEIYTTEVKYLEDLDILYQAKLSISKLQKNVICKQLKTGKPFCEHFRPRRLCERESRHRTPAVSEKDLDSVFLNLRSLINVHERIAGGLRKELSKLYLDIKEGKDVGIADFLTIYSTVFTTMSPFLTMYTQYIQRYSGAVAKQKMLRKTNPFFSDSISAMEKSHSLTLMSLINKPLHRITKYPLLFDTLVKYVRKFIKNELNVSMPDLEAKLQDISREQGEVHRYDKMIHSLDGANKMVRSIVDKVNLKVGEAENLEKMAKAYDEIGGPKKMHDLLQPWRRFKAEMTIGKVEFGGDYPDEHEDPVIFIFNDIIVVATPPAPLSRRLSLASITNTTTATVSVAKKAAGHLMNKTLGRASKRNLLSNSRASKKFDNVGFDLFSSQKANKKRDLRGSKSAISGHSSAATSKRKKSKTDMKAQSHSVLSRSKSTRRGKTSGGKDTNIRELSPVLTMKIIKFEEPDFSVDEDEDGEKVFVLKYHYDQKKLKNGDWEMISAIFSFKTESTRDEFVGLVESLQTEYNERKKGFEVAKAKERNKSVTRVLHEDTEL